MISTDRVRRGIELGLIVLTALMPFHAFLSVWLGSLTGHEAWIQAWKEVLLLILAAGGVYLVFHEPTLRSRLRSWPVVTAGLFALIALLVTAITFPPLQSAAFGAKTDLEYLSAFILSVIVATPALTRRLIKTIFISATIVVAFGLLQTYALPPDFLVQFGYGPNTVQPYLTLGPHADSFRFGSTLGGPNQLGTYILLPLSLALLQIARHRRWYLVLLFIGGIGVLIHTYSRSAWLGALAAFTITALLMAPNRLRIWVAGALAGLMIITAALLGKLVAQGGKLQYFVLHSDLKEHNDRGSDFEHIASLQNGLAGVLNQPLGHGLGTAGPAVFHGGHGPIIENNYLQVAYEAGLPGAAAYILMLAATGRELALRATHGDLAAASLAALVGISVTALVLPAWTDSTTALTFWTAAGAAIGIPRDRHV